MEAYSSVLQIFAIFVIVLIVFSFFRMLVSIARSKRIEDFAISSHNEGLTFEQRLYNIVYWLSDFISELVIFNSLSGAYERYVAMGDNKFKKGMDFIALKTLFGVASALMYVIWALIFNSELGILLVVISFFIGSIIPDIYYKLRYYKNNTDIVDDLLRAVIIINNSFRANRGVEQALNDVIERLDGPLKREFVKVKNDLRLGIDLGTAFRRMYDRTRISTIYDIANKMALIGEQGVNVVKVFENIEKDILEEEKIRNDVKNLCKFNSMLYYFLLVFPIFILGWIIVTNENILKYVISDATFIYAIVFTIIYVFYAIVMRKLVKVIYYER
jgi:Flp pilus assembly protein TadB